MMTMMIKQQLKGFMEIVWYHTLHEDQNYTLMRFILHDGRVVAVCLSVKWCEWVSGVRWEWFDSRIGWLLVVFKFCKDIICCFWLSVKALNSFSEWTNVLENEEIAVGYPEMKIYSWAVWYEWRILYWVSMNLWSCQLFLLGFPKIVRHTVGDRQMLSIGKPILDIHTQSCKARKPFSWN